MKKFNILLVLLGTSLLLQRMLAQTVPTAPVSDDTVVAIIDGKNLTAGEVRTALANMPLEFGKMYQQNPQGAIQNMYVMRYLGEEAEKAKLADESPLKEQLALLRADVLASAMLTHENNYFPVTEEMVQQYYEKNKTKYQQSKIKVIYIPFKPTLPAPGTPIEEIARVAGEVATSKTERTEADARKLAEDLVKQIRAGTDFGKLVAQYSEDAASKAAGGDFGVVNINSAYPDDIKNAVLALKAGEVADPIRQISAFYVIRVEDRNIQTVEAVTEPIRQELRQAHVNEWFTAIRNRFIPEVKNVQFFTQPSQGQPGSPPAPAAIPK